MFMFYYWVQCLILPDGCLSGMIKVVVGEEGWFTSSIGCILNHLENAGNKNFRDKALRGYVSWLQETELHLVRVSAGRQSLV